MSCTCAPNVKHKIILISLRKVLVRFSITLTVSKYVSTVISSRKNTIQKLKVVSLKQFLNQVMQKVPRDILQGVYFSVLIHELFRKERESLSLLKEIFVGSCYHFSFLGPQSDEPKFYTQVVKTRHTRTCLMKWRE